jgi:hypothetical protein
MVDIYSFQLDVVGQIPDLSGWTVEGDDGVIGTVDQATYHPRSSCMVVDTGPWLEGVQRLIPGAMVTGLDGGARVVRVSLNRQQVAQAPAHDEERHAADEAGYHAEQGGYWAQHAPD